MGPINRGFSFLAISVLVCLVVSKPAVDGGGEHLNLQGTMLNTEVRFRGLLNSFINTVEGLKVLSVYIT